MLAAAGLRRLDREAEIAFLLRARGDDAGRRGRDRWRSRRAARTPRPRPRRPGSRDHDALVELTAERAAVAALEASCQTPVGVCARLATGASWRCIGYAGLPDGSEWVRDRVAGDPEQPAALGEALAERHAGRRSRDDPRASGGA